MQKKENQNKYVYVVLVKALTGLGNFARFFGKYEYTHIAVCLDEKLDLFITFSRRKHCTPFDCGFMIETLDCYAFGEHTDVKLKVFKIPVLEDKKRKIEAYIDNVSKDDEYIFNIISMVTMPLLHGVKIYKAHNCMSFVGKIIELSGAVHMSREYYKYDINDIDILLTDFLYKEGVFVKKTIETKGYMDRVGVSKNILYFVRLTSKNIYRLITGRKVKDEGK